MAARCVSSRLYWTSRGANLNELAAAEASERRRRLRPPGKTRQLKAEIPHPKPEDGLECMCSRICMAGCAIGRFLDALWRAVVWPRTGARSLSECVPARGFGVRLVAADDNYRFLGLFGRFYARHQQRYALGWMDTCGVHVTRVRAAGFSHRLPHGSHVRC